MAPMVSSAAVLRVEEEVKPFWSKSGALKRRWRGATLMDLTAPEMRPLIDRGFEICIDGLSFWLMRIGREIGRGTSVQALRERRACQERADAQQAALPVQS